MIIKVSQAIFFATFLYGCLLGGGIEKSVSSGEGSLPPSNINITAAKVTATQLIINGSNFEGVTSVVMTTNARSFSKTFKVISASFNQLITEAIDDVKIPVNTALNLILSDAQGQTSFPIEFSLQNGAVTTGDIADGTITLPKIAPPPISGTETQVFAWDPTTQQYIFAPYDVAGTGNVNGPATSTDNFFAIWDGDNSKTLRQSSTMSEWSNGYPGFTVAAPGGAEIDLRSTTNNNWVQLMADVDYSGIWILHGGGPTIKINTTPQLSEIILNANAGANRDSNIAFGGNGTFFKLINPLNRPFDQFWNFPLNLPTGNQVIGTIAGADGFGNVILDWMTVGNVTGPGTLPNFGERPLAFFLDSAPNKIAFSSDIRKNGSGIHLGSASGIGMLTFESPVAGAGKLVTLTSPNAAQSASYTLYFPKDPPAINQILQSDAGGNLSWITPAASDGRLKKNIRPLKKNFLEEVFALAPVSFEWRKDKIKDRPDGIQRGLIAQEVQKIIPEAVYMNGDILTIDNYALFSTLIGAIKEQQKQIEELKRLIRKK